MEEADGDSPVVRDDVEEFAEEHPPEALTMQARRRAGMADQREVEQAVYRLAPAGTQEVADLIGVSRQAADQRLRVLDYREHIWSKKVGPTKVWMHPRIMDDPDPERDTSAEGLEPRIFGDIYRSSQGQPPFGSEAFGHPRRQHPSVFR